MQEILDHHSSLYLKKNYPFQGQDLAKLIANDEEARIIKPDSKSFDLNEWNDLFKEPGKSSYYLYKSAVPIAHAALNFKNGQLFLCYFIVHPMHRNRNIGDFLLSQMISEARKRKVDQLFLNVAINNIGATKLYLKHGFRPLLTRNDHIRMVLDI